MSTVGVPVKLLHESQGHIVTVELKTGQLYRGKLLDVEDSMNIQLKDITMTARDGQVSQLDQVFVRGSQIHFIIIPDMLKNAPLFKKLNAKSKSNIAAKGKSAAARASAGRGRARAPRQPGPRN